MAAAAAVVVVDGSTTSTIPTDILETILSRLPTFDLIPASAVSTAWHAAAASSLLFSPRRRHPWLLLRHHRHPPSPSTTLAFDPHTRSWHRISNPPNNPHPYPIATPPRSSTSDTLLFHLTPARLAFSGDPFHRKWIESPSPPSVWRSDPLVVSVGPYLVVAGGVCEFEDDPLAVEVLDLSSSDARWEVVESMPAEFECSGSAMWLSAAVAGGKVHVVEKSTGLFASFDPEKGEWGETGQVGQGRTFSLFAVAGAGEELVVAGLSVGRTEVSLWKVRCGTGERTEIGSMPPEMVGRLVENGNGTTISAMEIRTAATEGTVEVVYVYNSSDTREIFFCEMASGGGCEWGSVQNPVIGERSPMDRLLFSAAKVDVGVLREALRSPEKEI